MATSRDPNARNRFRVIRPGDSELHVPVNPRVRRAGLWFGVAGGPIAWGIDRLATVYVVSHQCRTAAPGLRLLGLSSWQTIEVLITIVTAIVALVAAAVSWRIWRQTGRPEEETAQGSIRSTPFWALGGFFLSVVFVLLILVTSGTAIALGANC